MWVADFREQIELRLVEFLEQQRSAAPTVESNLLLSRLSSLVLRGGKRFRPSLMFRTYVAYGGDDPKSLIDLGLALELFHQALLVHDDIIDDDYIRYDGPNIIGYYKQDKKFKGTKVPISMGVLAGDMLLSLVTKIIVNDKNFNSKQKTKILNLMADTTIGVIYGQQLDSISVVANAENYADQKLILTHSLKSALYTTMLPMRLAAIVLDMPESEIERIDQFATPFGIYFQLVDDFADYFVTDTLFDNHPKFRDYPEGKISYPYYIGLKLASPAKAEILKKQFGNKGINDEDKAKVLDILNKSGADEASRLFAERYYVQSVDNLKLLGISQKRKTQFKQLLDEFKI